MITKEGFSKIWIVIVFAVIFGGIVYFKFLAPRLFRLPCLTHLDCYLRISPNYLLKGYGAQCIHNRCIPDFSGEFQPL